MEKYFYYLIVCLSNSCSTNPYKASEKYDTKLKNFKETISNKEPELLPIVSKRY
jgi:N-acetylmuramoyl-L-alanine amidase